MFSKAFSGPNFGFFEDPLIHDCSLFTSLTFCSLGHCIEMFGFPFFKSCSSISKWPLASRDNQATIHYTKQWSPRLVTPWYVTWVNMLNVLLASKCYLRDMESVTCKRNLVRNTWLIHMCLCIICIYSGFHTYIFFIYTCILFIIW